MGFLVRLVVNAAALWVAAQLVPGIVVTGVTPLLLAALVLGLINAIVRPILLVLTLPLTLITLGLFIFVVNALILVFTEEVCDWFSIKFVVDGFWPAFVGALVISGVSFVISRFLRRNPLGRGRKLL